jgi:putative endonuclease
MSRYKINLGRWGENVAVDYLKSKGYSIADRNVRTPYGEIDIVAGSQDLLIFVEVKTRSTTSYGMPEASVTQQKRKHIIDAVEFYFQEHPDLDCDWRIDVIAIRGKQTTIKPEITHFQNAITNE